MGHHSLVPPPVTGPVDIVVRPPGSKSISNRALVCAALAEGRSRLTGVATGDDTRAMIAGLGALGVHFDGPVPGVSLTAPDSTSPVGPAIVVNGLGGPPSVGGRTVECALAGTTSRFLAAVLAIGSRVNRLDGGVPLRRRPMGPLFDALRQLGAVVEAAQTNPGDGSDRDHLPVTIGGPLRGGQLDIRGDVSSQFLSALMLVSPLLDDGLELRWSTPLVSRPYVEMTAAVMAQFGAGVEVHSDRVSISAGRYRATDLQIEPDASSASYPLALAALRGGRATIDGLGSGSIQGDRRFADIAAVMGCSVEWGSHSVTLERAESSPLVGVDVDLREASDLVPTVAVLACRAEGVSRLTGIGFIRHKESDRIGDLADELGRIGVTAIGEADALVVEAHSAPLRGATIETHHDHRMAMAFGVLASATATPLRIADPDVVSKSWPDFWHRLDGWCRSGDAGPRAPGAS